MLCYVMIWYAMLLESMIGEDKSFQALMQYNHFTRNKTPNIEKYREMDLEEDYRTYRFSHIVSIFLSGIIFYNLSIIYVI